MRPEIKPDFYDNFICEADRCTFTCCQEWKISVDEETLLKWKKIPHPDCDKSELLCESTTNKDGGNIIKLNHEKQCPFLQKNRLCKLVITYGDEILSETCATFPREIHDFEDRVEYALMPCCPVVVDKLNGGMFELSMANFVKEQPKENLLFQIRQFLMDLMKNKDCSPEEAFLMIFYFALEFLERQEAGTLQCDTLSKLKEGGVISQLQSAVKDMKTEVVDTFYECSELFLDLVENYRKEGLYEKHLAHAAQMAETILKGNLFKEDEIEDKWQEFQAVWCTYEHLWRNFLLEEIYADCLMPQGDLETMVMKLQWIAMEYVVIRQMVFLRWQQNGQVSYEEIRDCIVVVCRMMGYDEEDIEVYLTNSFEELIWEWGYLALIMGK